MAATIVHRHAMQTPGIRRAEGLAVGVSVSCVTTKGGPTAETEASMLLPSISGAGGTNHWRSKKFTLDLTPTDFWSFGFWVFFINVDVASGQNPVLFYQTVRNSLNDLSLELRHNASGHTFHIVNSLGASVDSDVNSFPEATWTWVESYYSKTVATVLVNRVVVLTAIADFFNDPTDDQCSMEFDGQTDSGSGATTVVHLAQGYFGENGSGQDDLLSFPLVGGKKFECTTYRLGATSNHADEFDVDNGGEGLGAGALVDTADDDILTSADYIGVSFGTVGATWALDTGLESGPAPRWNKWEASFGVKFVWNTNGGTGGGTRTVRYGYFDTDTNTWVTSSVAIGNRIKFTEAQGAAGVGSFPPIPSASKVGAIGWFITNVINTLELREGYMFVFGLEGEGQGNFLMKSKKVKSRTSLVAQGGRVG